MTSRPEKVEPEAPAGVNREPFLARWSRRKEEARREEPVPQVSKVPDPNAPAPELPPLEKLTLESDYRGFFHPKVGEDLRRAALKKLFSDAHFNVMDGLDVYIDDYSKSEPIPAAMLAQLKQAQKILGWAKERQDHDKSSAGAAPDQAPVAPDAERIAPPEAATTVVPETASNVVAEVPRDRPAERTAARSAD